MATGGGRVMKGSAIIGNGKFVPMARNLQDFSPTPIPIVGSKQRRMEQQKIKGEVAANVAAVCGRRGPGGSELGSILPLMAAEDAVVIDRTKLSEAEVLAKVEELAGRTICSDNSYRTAFDLRIPACKGSRAEARTGPRTMRNGRT